MNQKRKFKSQQAKIRLRVKKMTESLKNHQKRYSKRVVTRLEYL